MQDLVKLSEEERSAKLCECGVAESALPAIQKMLLSLPHAHITSVKAFVDGEEDIKEQDMLTVRVHVAITRGAHIDADVLPSGTAAVAAHTPRFPLPTTEKWCALLCCLKLPHAGFFSGYVRKLSLTRG